METDTTEATKNSDVFNGVTDKSHDNLIASNGKYQEMRQETGEEVRSILKVIAATGKFWYDWEKLRNMLSLHLMQVISEYPQAKMTIEEQKTSLGETLADLAKRLDNALHRFVDGPPFTLQRLSEIILDARVLYPDLSKLALALMKNLSVTSTLTISTDPYPLSLITATNASNKVTNYPSPSPSPSPSPNLHQQHNIFMAVVADEDEIMSDAEADVSNATTMDAEHIENPLESNPMTADVVGSTSEMVQTMGLSRL